MWPNITQDSFSVHKHGDGQCLYEVIALSQSEAWKAPRYEVTIGHNPLQRRVTVGHLTYIHDWTNKKTNTKSYNNAENINVNKYTQWGIFALWSHSIF